MSYEELEEVESQIFELLTDGWKRRPRGFEEALGYVISKGYFTRYAEEKIKEIRPTIKNIRLRAFMSAILEFTDHSDPKGSIKEDVVAGSLGLFMFYKTLGTRMPSAILNPQLLSLYKNI